MSAAHQRPYVVVPYCCASYVSSDFATIPCPLASFGTPGLWCMCCNLGAGSLLTCILCGSSWHAVKRRLKTSVAHHREFPYERFVTMIRVLLARCTARFLALMRRSIPSTAFGWGAALMLSTREFRMSLAKPMVYGPQMHTLGLAGGGGGGGGG